MAILCVAMNTSPDLKKTMDLLWREATFTWDHLRMWRDMQHFFSTNSVLASKWVGFVRLTLKAHLEAAVLGTSRLLEQNKRASGVNIEYLLNLVQEQRRNCPSLGHEELCAKVAKDRLVLEEWRQNLDSIKNWRDKLLAHVDKGQIEAPETFSVEIEELRTCVQSLFTMITRYAQLFFRQLYVCGTPGQEDFNKVAFVLKIGDENWRRMVLESSEAVKDNPRACLQDGLPPFIKSPDEWAWNGLGLEAP